MIESVNIFKMTKNVRIRYQSGCVRTFATLPDAALKFILNDEVKAFENEASTMYREV